MIETSRYEWGASENTGLPRVVDSRWLCGVCHERTVTGPGHDETLTREAMNDPLNRQRAGVKSLLQVADAVEAGARRKTLTF
jgi:hypothetical protein